MTESPLSDTIKDVKTTGRRDRERESDGRKKEKEKEIKNERKKRLNAGKQG